VRNSDRRVSEPPRPKLLQLPPDLRTLTFDKLPFEPDAVLDIRLDDLLPTSGDARSFYQEPIPLADGHCHIT
jgi:hypothetical protein